MSSNHCTTHASLDRFASVDCAACDDVRRENFFAANPEKRASYEARKASVAARKEREAADAAAYAAKYRALADADWMLADLAPVTHRRVLVQLECGAVEYAVAADADAKALESRLYWRLAQGTDGVVICSTLSIETDEQIAARVREHNKEAA